MKNSLYLLALVLGLILISCTAQKTSIKQQKDLNSNVNDTIKIANDDLEYEVIIIDPGFSTWLNSMAQPRGFYTQSYLETKINCMLTNGTIAFYNHNATAAICTK